MTAPEDLCNCDIGGGDFHAAQCAVWESLEPGSAPGAFQAGYSSYMYDIDYAPDCTRDKCLSYKSVTRRAEV